MGSPPDCDIALMLRARGLVQIVLGDESVTHVDATETFLVSDHSGLFAESSRMPDDLLDPIVQPVGKYGNSGWFGGAKLSCRNCSMQLSGALEKVPLRVTSAPLITGVIGTPRAVAMSGELAIILLHGAMAQLGARLHGMQKVASSSLAGSSRKSFNHRYLRLPVDWRA